MAPEKKNWTKLVSHHILSTEILASNTTELKLAEDVKHNTLENLDKK